MEEEEDEGLAGVSPEDKSRRPPGKGPPETAHSGEGRGCGRRLGKGRASVCPSPPRMPA